MNAENAEIREILAGYARASEYIEAERIKRLARMPSEEARAIFNELTEGWEQLSSAEKGLPRLEGWRLETLLAVRQAMMGVARATGYL